MKKICHLTSVHPRYDARIFFKECGSLAGAGYRIYLLVADGKGDELCHGIRIIDMGVPAGRLDRMLKITRKMFDQALDLDCEVYHLHDPELLPMGRKLRRLNKKVIFDSHEDIPAQIVAKTYLYKPLRWLLAYMYQGYSRHILRDMNAIVAATPHIRERMTGLNSNITDIRNYPLPAEPALEKRKQDKQNLHVCYIGSVSEIRGIKEIVAAMDIVQSGIRLHLGGLFVDNRLKLEVANMPGWDRIEEHGWLDRQGILQVMDQSFAGLVTLHPAPNYLEALSTKMFEYMSAGIPVIASDFPLWRRIIQENQCGVCVNPLDPRAIAQAIDYLAEHPVQAREMGERGQKAVRQKYTWQSEKQKLLTLYSKLFSDLT